MTGRAVAEDLLAEVETVIDRVFQDAGGRLGDLAGFDAVWEEARQGAAGGKLLRPRLLLAAQGAYAGEPAESAVHAAAALELLHLAFLLHDDVIDRDVLRRGEPNLIARRRDAAQAAGADEAGALRYGDSCAILAGDLLLSAAHRLIAELDAPTAHRRALLAVLGDAIEAAAVGEHADVVLGLRGDADEEAVLRTMEHKTARYSFSAPLRMGALLGGADPAAIDTLGFIGTTIGIAFQARDDVLGVFGDPERTGKSVLSDLREGKVTLLVAHSRSHASWREASALFGDPGLDERGAAVLRTAIVESGGLARTEAAISGLVAEARAALLFSALPAPLIAELESVIARATERTR
ncbi:MULTISPECIES: polyprenyl synthetase family protein [unclassified Microbacterium]|uniref:polyprenyl synthetase family protein n=1 Tax=unclassified Microbacterium TaxID=2609290 RepID=UPI003015D2CE